jgi:hypothetical protein
MKKTIPFVYVLCLALVAAVACSSEDDDLVSQGEAQFDNEDVYDADGGYPARDGGDGGYPARDGGDGGYPARDGGDGGYPARDGGDGGYPARDGGDGGYPARDGGDGGYPARDGGDGGDGQTYFPLDDA